MFPRFQSDGKQAWIFVKLERILWAIVVVVSLYASLAFFEEFSARWTVGAQEAKVTRDVNQDGPIVPDSSPGSMYTGSQLQPKDDGSVIGSINIPTIGLLVPITTGINKVDLLRGAGHVPGSALPGGLGNTGIAAHRDTFFRPLREIKTGASVFVRGQGGTYSYMVDSIEIVTPDHIGVFDIGSQPQLTLVTCYPFDYIGAAPKRFIVHAHLASMLPIEAN